MTSSAKPGKFKTALQGIVLLIFLIVLLEFALQFIALSSMVASDPGNFINPDRLKKAEISTQVFDPVLGFRPNPEYPEHDDRGFRNAHLPQFGKVEVVAIGDSQTYGVGVNRHEAWPQKLGSRSERTVYNMAYGGYGPSHYLELMKEGLTFKPKIVIVAFYAGNDLYDSFRMVYDNNYKGRLKRSYNPKVLEGIKEANIRMSIEAEATRRMDDPAEKFQYRPQGNFMALLPKLKLYQAWVRSRGWVMENWEGQKFCQEPASEQDSFEAPPASSTELTPGYRFLASDLSDPRTREGLRLSMDAFNEMKALTNKAGVRFIVIMIPSKEHVYEPAMRSQNPPKKYRRLVRNEQTVFRELEQFLSQQEIPHLSMLPALRHALVLGLSPYPASGDGHPASSGQSAIARCVEELVGQDLPAETL